VKESLYRRLDSIYGRLEEERAALLHDLEAAFEGTGVRVQRGRVCTCDVRLSAAGSVLEIDLSTDGRLGALSFEGFRPEPIDAFHESFSPVFVTHSRQEAVARAIEHFGPLPCP